VTGADYKREHRAANPDRYKASEQRRNARISSALRVAAEHRDQWDDAYVAECARRGVDPFPHVGRPRAGGE
jgi:hypothetical protein